MRCRGSRRGAFSGSPDPGRLAPTPELPVTLPGLLPLLTSQLSPRVSPALSEGTAVLYAKQSMTFLNFFSCNNCKFREKLQEGYNELPNAFHRVPQCRTFQIGTHLPPGAISSLPLPPPSHVHYVIADPFRRVAPLALNTSVCVS